MLCTPFETGLHSGIAAFARAVSASAFSDPAQCTQRAVCGQHRDACGLGVGDSRSGLIPPLPCASCPARVPCPSLVPASASATDCPPNLAPQDQIRTSASAINDPQRSTKLYRSCSTALDGVPLRAQRTRTLILGRDDQVLEATLRLVPGQNHLQPIEL